MYLFRCNFIEEVGTFVRKHLVQNVLLFPLRQ